VRKAGRKKRGFRVANPCLRSGKKRVSKGIPSETKTLNQEQVKGLIGKGSNNLRGVGWGCVEFMFKGGRKEKKRHQQE